MATRKKTAVEPETVDNSLETAETATPEETMQPNTATVAESEPEIKDNLVKTEKASNPTELLAKFNRFLPFMVSASAFNTDSFHPLGGLIEKIVKAAGGDDEADTNLNSAEITVLFNAVEYSLKMMRSIGIYVPRGRSQQLKADILELSDALGREMPPELKEGTGFERFNPWED